MFKNFIGYTIHFISEYPYWPALPTIHRGLEWPQCLNCSLFDCSLFSANFLILLLILLCYSSVSYVIYWPAPPTIHRGLEWPQCLNCSLSVCLSACSLSVLCKFSNFSSPHPPLL